ncbi:LD-carboxypeptidase [Streptococcus didelphis]|uniref:LD-carboxypeptidase n=1 Tax=Streptococcus didelphis TaxID=102886 RepID=A0ABY9LGD1_9STRE|nr:LD-carboxypeptidase [Streptococcus didelphis]WMB27823.1 LD-carboxypeptidase [Streptococcus didelphis]WMB29714.1 LD-carboxypeptidase [Streptococcus didelphis]
MKIQNLKIGDTIGIFSSSSPATEFGKKRYERAKKFWLDKGFNIKEGKLTGKSGHYRSGTIEQRSQELNELIYDSNIKCIMATIGGVNSNSLLPYIDYDYLKQQPKIIIDYSDITAILFAIYAKTGLNIYYGSIFWRVSSLS